MKAAFSVLKSYVCAGNPSGKEEPRKATPASTADDAVETKQPDLTKISVSQPDVPTSVFATYSALPPKPKVAAKPPLPPIRTKKAPSRGSMLDDATLLR